MCIAILNTINPIKNEYIKNSWDNNEQGGGLLWVENGVLNTFKTYQYKTFLKTYKAIRKRIDGKIVLHFRIATSGFKSMDNLHPFLVNENLGFVHNGVLSGLGNKDYSDTYEFNEMLKKLPIDFLENATILAFIEKYITSSKLIFLDSSDKATIVNEKLGHWIGSDWFSNDSYIGYNDFIYSGNEKVARNANQFDWDSYTFNDSFNKQANLIYNDSDFEKQRFAQFIGTTPNAKDFHFELTDWSNYYNVYDLQVLNDLIESEYDKELI
jgi:hypothetical protein